MLKNLRKLSQFRWLLYSTLVLIALLASCRIGPKYSPPKPPVPTEWKGGQSADTNSSDMSGTEAKPIEFMEFWWNVFEDETLDCLENQAITNNHNLKMAFDRIIEARAMANATRADLFPQVNLQPVFSDTGILFKLYLPPGIDFGPNPLPRGLDFRVHQMLYTLPFNMSYQVDLWDQIGRQYESAVMNTQAQAYAYYTTLLTLTTDLASAYFQLRSLDSQINFLKMTADNLEAEYQLTKSRYEKGLSNLLDVTTAKVQVSNVRSNYEDALRQRIIQENAIAVLVGVPSSEFSLESMPLQGNPPIIPEGTPASILLKRPDIAQAERTRASQHTLIGVAYAAFFPSLQLTGTLGFSSPDFRQFLKWISRLWSFGANASVPIFDGGLNQANYELAWANFMEADQNYQQQVLVAFREVEDALNNLERQYVQAQWLAESSESSQQMYALSKKRYEQGLISSFEVFDNQRFAINAESSYITLQGIRYLSTIQLIKALGGGWETPKKMEPVPEPSCEPEITN